MNGQASESGDGASGPSGFLFVGGDTSIDFANTEMIEGGRKVDRVSTPAELAAWVAASTLGRVYGTPTVIEPRIHAQAIDVRGALQAGFNALIDREPVPESTVQTLNAVLGRAPGAQLRVDTTGALRLVPQVDLMKDADPLPWLLANAGAELLCSERITLLRRCANRDHCMLVFLDTSRSHTRRWCSMDLCGNRRKVAAHQSRARQRRGGDRA